MPQLTVDVDREFLADGTVRETGRVTKFARQHFRPGETRTFVGFWDTNFIVSVERVGDGLRFDLETIAGVRLADRFLLLVDTRRRKRAHAQRVPPGRLRWFDGAAAAVEHILARADAEFIQSAVELPPVIDAEIRHPGSKATKHQAALLGSLLLHMVFRQVLGWPAAQGLGRLVAQVGGRDAEVRIGNVATDDPIVAELDRRCRDALRRLLESAQDQFEILELEGVSEQLPQLAAAVVRGDEVRLPAGQG